MCVDTIIKQLEGVLLFFEKYRNEGFASSIGVAKSIALGIDVEPIFQKKTVMFLGKNNLMKVMRME